MSQASGICGRSRRGPDAIAQFDRVRSGPKGVASCYHSPRPAGLLLVTLTVRARQVYSSLLDDLRLLGGKERYARPVRDNRRSGGDCLAARPARYIGRVLGGRRLSRRSFVFGACQGRTLRTEQRVKSQCDSRHEGGRDSSRPSSWRYVRYESVRITGRSQAAEGIAPFRLSTKRENRLRTGLKFLRRV